MGNFSRNTFDPDKRYVGVRLQQGVPLVDADWNELNDVVRHEAYSGLQQITSQTSAIQVFQQSDAFRILAISSPNDLYMYGGLGFSGGQPVYSPDLPYNTQPLRDPSVAAAWGVDPVPDLTTPTAARVDVVYVDLWEREIDSDEDTDIVNPVIGMETAVRLKREVALRVREGSAWPDMPPADHEYRTVGLLNRTAGNDSITQAMIEDARSIASSQLPGYYAIDIPPIFNNYSDVDAWQNFIGRARKRNGFVVAGLIPLHLPHGSRIDSLWFRGAMYNIASGTTTLALRIYRVTPEESGVSVSTLIEDSQSNVDTFSRAPFVSADVRRIDASQYMIYAIAYGPGQIDLRSLFLFYDV